MIWRRCLKRFLTDFTYGGEYISFLVLIIDPRTCNICSPAREYLCRCDATRVPAPMFARIWFCRSIYDILAARSCTRFVRIASAFVSHLQACNDPSSRRNGGAKSRWKEWLVSPIRGRGEGETTRSEFEIFWTRPFLLQAVGSRVKPDGINRI